MPFTLSHPAAVLPLRRFGIFSALVVGSMMPDVLYFIPIVGPLHRGYGHTWEGLFLFCLPAGLALLWLFHAFLKSPLISLFPIGQQGKLQTASTGFQFGPAKRSALIIGSVLVGAATHITWDAFTHANSWGAAHVAFLRQPVPVPPHFTFLVAELLQLFSSVFGALLLLISYIQWLRRTPQPASAPDIHLPTALRVLLFLAFLAGALAPSVARLILNPGFWLYARRGLIGYGAVDGIKVVCVEVVIFSAVWHLMHREKPRASPVSHSS